jgi:hypothetical protein
MLRIRELERWAQAQPQTDLGVGLDPDDAAVLVSALAQLGHLSRLYSGEATQPLPEDLGVFARRTAGFGFQQIV